MDKTSWHDVGSIERFADGFVSEVDLIRLKIAVSRRQGKFGVISGVCNHVGGPLGKLLA